MNWVTMQKYRITYYRGTPQEGTFDLYAPFAFDVPVLAGVELGFLFKNKKDIPGVDKIEAVDEVAEKLALVLAASSINKALKGKSLKEVEKI